MLAYIIHCILRPVPDLRVFAGMVRTELVHDDYLFQSKDASGKVVEETVIGYDPNRKEVFLDRSRSGRLDFSEKFSSRDVAPANLQEGKINLHVFIDESTIVVFVNHGEVVLSSQVFPKMNQGGIELYNKGDGRTVANTYNAWSYNSTWDALK